MRLYKNIIWIITLLSSNYLLGQNQIQRYNCDSMYAVLEGQYLTTELDSHAEFRGGENELYKFQGTLKLKKNIENNHGIYFISIFIEEDGEISNACILRPEKPYPHGESILKWIHTMPKWTPARKNGEPVKSIYNLPVRFCTGR